MKTLTIALLALLTVALPAPATLTPCTTEDQTTACYWDSAQRGNGVGQSFIVTDHTN